MPTYRKKTRLRKITGLKKRKTKRMRYKRNGGGRGQYYPGFPWITKDYSEEIMQIIRNEPKGEISTWALFNKLKSRIPEASTTKSSRWEECKRYIYDDINKLVQENKLRYNPENRDWLLLV